MWLKSLVEASCDPSSALFSNTRLHECVTSSYLTVPTAGADTCGAQAVRGEVSLPDVFPDVLQVWMHTGIPAGWLSVSTSLAEEAAPRWGYQSATSPSCASIQGHLPPFFLCLEIPIAKAMGRCDMLSTGLVFLSGLPPQRFSLVIIRIIIFFVFKLFLVLC